jgi:hypothetical protein
MRPELARTLLESLDLRPELVDTHLGALEFMARYKYDHYEMYAPGARFMLHLYYWLKQLKTVAEREAALEFVRSRLVFVSQREMQDLARFLYYDVITSEILKRIITQERLGPYEYVKAFQHFRPYLRRCLFIGLSDGAKIDYLRRHHIDLSQEQILPFYRTPGREYVERLREDTGDPDATFWAVFLIDDFTGSGSTLIREELDPDSGARRPTGSLVRLCEYQKEAIASASAIYLCHYISSAQAQQHVRRLVSGVPEYKGKFHMRAALTLEDDVRVYPPRDGDALSAQLCDICEGYYHKAFESPNTARDGGIKYGYANAGLPIVLYSNTPNNSIYPIWLNCPLNSEGAEFWPLFRRIDRHRVR